jgi:hypothetical protein
MQIENLVREISLIVARPPGEIDHLQGLSADIRHPAFDLHSVTFEHLLFRGQVCFSHEQCIVTSNAIVLAQFESVIEVN